MSRRRYKRNPNVSRAARVGAPARRRSHGKAFMDILPVVAIAAGAIWFFSQTRSSA
jgi:hypothetical protein